MRILEGRRTAAIRSREPPATEAGPRLIIEAVAPCLDSGRYAVKRIVGDVAHIECDAYAEGHDAIAVAVLWRAADETVWREKRMTPIGNDRWAADLPLDRVGRYLFGIEAWRDEFAIFRIELQKKHDAGLSLTLELKRGRVHSRSRARSRRRRGEGPAQRRCGSNKGR